MKLKETGKCYLKILFLDNFDGCNKERPKPAAIINQDNKIFSHNLFFLPTVVPTTLQLLSFFLFMYRITH